MMPAEATNRVKSIRNRFESLSDQGLDGHKTVPTRAVKRTSVPVQCRKAYTNAKNQLQKQNSEPIVRESVRSKRTVLIEIENTNENSTENHKITYKKRLKDGDCSSDNILSLPLIQSPTDTRKEYKVVTKSNSAVNGEKPRTLSRQTSDPSRKLQRSPAFRCDRNHKPWDGCRRSLRLNFEETPKVKLGERPHLSREKLIVLGHILDRRMKEDNFVFDKSTDLLRKPSVTNEDVPKHILDQYAKVVKCRDKVTSEPALIDSGISSENENLQPEVETEKISSLKILKAHFEAKNEVTLTDTLKKALKQPLPMGPPPKKPPRTFATILSTSEEVSPCTSPKEEQKQLSPHKRQDSRAMLEKLELALLQHNSGKTLSPRVVRKCKTMEESSGMENDSAPSRGSVDSDRCDLKSKLSLNGEIKEANAIQTQLPTKDMHYLCTEILGLHTNTDPSINSDGGLSSLAKCFNSLNCTNASIRSSIGYTKLESERTSISNGCCNCNVLHEQAKDTSASFSSKKVNSPCRKCSLKKCICKESNPTIEEIVHMSNSTFFAGNVFAGEVRSRLKRSKSQEHIYAEPFQHQRDATIISQPPLLRTVTLLEDGFRSKRSEFATFQRPSEDPPLDFKQNTELKGIKVRDILQKLQSRSTSDTSQSTVERQNNAKPKISILGSPTNDVAVNNIYDALPLDNEPDNIVAIAPSKASSASSQCGTQERRSRLYGRLDARASRRNHVNHAFRSQLDIDKENLNRLMNDIYETVAAACKVDLSSPDPIHICCASHGTGVCHCTNDFSLEDEANMRRLAKFPVNSDNTDSSSEDSVKLTRSLTEKRKNYVRRVSSRAAYLEATNPGSVRVRYRHQSPVISSDCLDQEPTIQSNGKCNNPYATFRSWKSFKMLHSMKDSDVSASEGMVQPDVMDSSILSATDTKDVELDIEAKEERLFDACILVGMNHYTGRAYIKSSFPNGIRLPPQIETLVFPEMIAETTYLSTRSPPAGRRRQNRTPELNSDKPHTSRKTYNMDASRIQCYSLVLTNEKGERNFGYCRRVLPEGATFCLPLAYCVISRYRSTAFFYKILELIESHHGSPDIRMESTLKQLHEAKFPQPGDCICLRQLKSPKKSAMSCSTFRKNSNYRNSVNLGDVFQARNLKVHSDEKAPIKESMESLLSESDNGRRRSRDGGSIFYDYENNNVEKGDGDGNPNQEVAEAHDGDFDEFTLKMSLEPRLDEDNLGVLLDSMTVSMIVKIFGTLLIERKVVLVSDNLSQLSSCMEALQTILYPFVWQHTLISTVPLEIRRDILEAPIPVLAGVLLTCPRSVTPTSQKKEVVAKCKTMPNMSASGGMDTVQAEEDFEEQIKTVKFEEGMLVDLTSKNGNKPVFVQGDESTLLPSYLCKTLKAALSLDSAKEKGKGDSMERTRNFLIAEAFLRFFMELIGDYWKYFSIDGKRIEEWGSIKSQHQQPPNVQFEKEQFIKGAGTKQASYFLEWFTETAMFNHFITNMAAALCRNDNPATDGSQADILVDIPYPDFYRLLEERMAQKKASQEIKKMSKGDGQSKGVSDGSKSANYKLLVGRKVKLLRSKLRDFVNLE